jgi:hypothetical protein
MLASAVAFVVSWAILAAGNPGAASAALIHVSLTAFADSIAPASPNRVVLTRCLSDNVQFSCSKPPKKRTVYISAVIISQQS